MIIEGTIHWCKLDKPRDNYNKQRKIMKDGEPDGWGRQWSVEIGNLSKETKMALKEAGLLTRVKNKMDEREDFIAFKLSEFKRNGDPNDPPKVVDSNGHEWDWKNDGLIGNESKGAAKFNIWRPNNGNASAFLVGLMVKDLVPYEQDESAGSYEDPDDWSDFVETFAAPAKAAKKRGKAQLEEGELDDDMEDIAT